MTLICTNVQEPTIVMSIWGALQFLCVWIYSNNLTLIIVILFAYECSQMSSIHVLTPVWLHLDSLLSCTRRPILNVNWTLDKGMTFLVDVERQLFFLRLKPILDLGLQIGHWFDHRWLNTLSFYFLWESEVLFKDCRRGRIWHSRCVEIRLQPIILLHTLI